MISAAPVRSHLLRLQRIGLGGRTVHEATGLSRTSIGLLRSGRQKKVLTVNAQKILAVDIAAASDRCLIDPGDTWDKLDALRERGYTMTQLARWLGYTGRGIQIRRGRPITARSVLRVEKLYSALEEGRLKRA